MGETETRFNQYSRTVVLDISISLLKKKKLGTSTVLKYQRKTLITSFQQEKRLRQKYVIYSKSQQMKRQFN